MFIALFYKIYSNEYLNRLISIKYSVNYLIEKSPMTYKTKCLHNCNKITNCVFVIISSNNECWLYSSLFNMNSFHFVDGQINYVKQF